MEKKTKTQRKKKSENKRFTFLAWVSIIIGSLFFITAILLFAYKTGQIDSGNNIDAETFGNLGSVIAGFCGTLWSLASVFFFYAALKFQREDLKDQKDEFALQRFETSFFQLLSLHHEIVNTLHGTKVVPVRDMVVIGGNQPLTERVEATGRECLLTIYNSLRAEYEAKKVVKSKDDNQVVKEAYEEVFKWHQGELDHYFRNLYHVLNYIRQAPIKRKIFYRQVIRRSYRQLSYYYFIIMVTLGQGNLSSGY